jgi:hypothetical protein
MRPEELAAAVVAIKRARKPVSLYVRIDYGTDGYLITSQVPVGQAKPVSMWAGEFNADITLRDLNDALDEAAIDLKNMLRDRGRRQMMACSAMVEARERGEV